MAARRPGLAPRPVPTVHGELAATVSGHRFTVSEWISGRRPGAEPKTCTWIGEAAAALHGLPAAARDSAVPLHLVGGAAASTRVASRFGQRGRRPSPPGRRGSSAVVHGQLNLANVIQRLDGGVALLEWDEAGTGLSAIDPGLPADL